MEEENLAKVASFFRSSAKAKVRRLDRDMSYDEVEIEDMEWSEELQAFTYPCPCGDLFQITKEELCLGEEIARCPSCSLFITVVYNPEDFAADPTPDPNSRKKPSPVAVA
ncbi:hypothetical protein GW17_00030461 [Ensete ventricosum]|nr:hypothetical protein GW17_00030461 [Ensete ventricosum]